MYYYIFLNKRVLVRTIEVDTTKFPQFICTKLKIKCNIFEFYPYNI